MREQTVREEGADDRFLLFQYDEVLCGLFAYNMIRGDLCVDADWVVPDDDPWPMPLRGLPLGFLVNVVRLQRDVLYRHYPERYRMLDGLGFYWLDPVFEDWQDISVRGVGDGKPLPGPFGDILDGAKQLDSR
ncbi:hypothetical protein JKP88DRAFT_354425 [Tribonema minus]|uniref:Uncharacterized protein n=1 Tax=Tribonema minus TaxID=303371 RepID=A0A835Z154_9STRA|nr:hypothetical protein JKP88DRAFT_354425 [Tribonema minus]